MAWLSVLLCLASYDAPRRASECRWRDSRASLVQRRTGGLAAAGFVFEGSAVVPGSAYLMFAEGSRWKPATSQQFISRVISALEKRALFHLYRSAKSTLKRVSDL